MGLPREKFSGPIADNIVPGTRGLTGSPRHFLRGLCGPHFLILGVDAENALAGRSFGGRPRAPSGRPEFDALTTSCELLAGWAQMATVSTERRYSHQRHFRN